MVTLESCLVHRMAALPWLFLPVLSLLLRQGEQRGGYPRSSRCCAVSLLSGIPEMGRSSQMLSRISPSTCPGPKVLWQLKGSGSSHTSCALPSPGCTRSSRGALSGARAGSHPPGAEASRRGGATTSWQDGDADRDLQLVTTSGASHNAVFPGCAFLHFWKHWGLSYNCQCFILPNTYISQSQLLPLSSREDRTSVKKVGRQRLIIKDKLLQGRKSASHADIRPDCIFCYKCKTVVPMDVEAPLTMEEQPRLRFKGNWVNPWPHYWLSTWPWAGGIISLVLRVLLQGIKQQPPPWRATVMMRGLTGTHLCSQELEEISFGIPSDSPGLQESSPASSIMWLREKELSQKEINPQNESIP